MCPARENTLEPRVRSAFSCSQCIIYFRCMELCVGGNDRLHQGEKKYYAAAMECGSIEIYLRYSRCIGASRSSNNVSDNVIRLIRIIRILLVPAAYSIVLIFESVVARMKMLTRIKAENKSAE